jgi:hypothetical protein
MAESQLVRFIGRNAKEARKPTSVMYSNLAISSH